MRTGRRWPERAQGGNTSPRSGGEVPTGTPIRERALCSEFDCFFFSGVLKKKRESFFLFLHLLLRCFLLHPFSFPVLVAPFAQMHTSEAVWPSELQAETRAIA